MPTPWGTWITCEETTIGVDAGYKKPHGYVFEVDPLANEPVLTKPYKKLGRFLHEAGAVDPDTGVVYMTEDEGPDGFYRFVPETSGDLTSGQLQMLRVKGQPKYNTIVGQTVGAVLVCNWVNIDTPDPSDAEDNASAVFHEGRSKGGAKFLGGEGCTYRDGGVVFGSSDGGDKGLGQIWQYTPTTNIGELNEQGELELLFESTARQIARRAGQHDDEPRWRDRDRRGRQPQEQLRAGSAAQRLDLPDRREPGRGAAALPRGLGQALRPDGSR